MVAPLWAPKLLPGVPWIGKSRICHEKITHGFPAAQPSKTPMVSCRNPEGLVLRCFFFSLLRVIYIYIHSIAKQAAHVLLLLLDPIME